MITQTEIGKVVVTHPNIENVEDITVSMCWNIDSESFEFLWYSNSDYVCFLENDWSEPECLEKNVLECLETALDTIEREFEHLRSMNTDLDESIAWYRWYIKKCKGAMKI